MLYTPNVYRWCNQSFTHVLRFLRFLNSNWHNKNGLANKKQSPGYVLWERCSYKFRKIHRKTPVPESPFLIKLQVRPTTLLKKDTGTGVFLWILRNFKEHLFYKTPPGDCFWKLLRKVKNAPRSGQGWCIYLAQEQQAG